MEYLNLGAVPYDESCAQVGMEGYRDKAIMECRAYVNQLYRQFPDAEAATFSLDTRRDRS